MRGKQALLLLARLIDRYKDGLENGISDCTDISEGSP